MEEPPEPQEMVLPEELLTSERWEQREEPVAPEALPMEAASSDSTHPQSLTVITTWDQLLLLPVPEETGP